MEVTPDGLETFTLKPDPPLEVGKNQYRFVMELKVGTVKEEESETGYYESGDGFRNGTLGEEDLMTHEEDRLELSSTIREAFAEIAEQEGIQLAYDWRHATEVVNVTIEDYYFSGTLTAAVLFQFLTELNRILRLHWQPKATAT